MLKKILLTSVLSLSVAGGAVAQQSGADSVPTLVVTNKPINQGAPQVSSGSPVSGRLQSMAPRAPMVQSRTDDLYSKPVMVQEIRAESVLDSNYFTPMNTMTAGKISNIQSEMYGLQSKVADAASELRTLETVGQDLAANYYAAIATINTQLQSGTTQGNPRLKNRLTIAEDALDTLSGNVTDLNTMAVQVADLASVSNFLQQESRAAYGLSGAVEEDHVQLAQLEDELSNTATAIERLLNSVNDNITRAAAYMTSERANIRTIALAISNGDLYGTSLSNRPFSMAQGTDVAQRASYSQSGIGENQQLIGKPSAPRPLMKVRFDRPDVEFSQALYMSVSDALKQYPNSEFELVAVSPGMGNPAKLAIESTRARRNAEKVLRNMVQMGVDTNRVKLANLTEDNLQFNEVHLYIR
jgi:uncharacterized protein YoxC